MSKTSLEEQDLRAAIATLADALRGSLEVHRDAEEHYLARMRPAPAREPRSEPATTHNVKAAMTSGLPSLSTTVPVEPERPTSPAAVSETDAAILAQISSRASATEKLGCIARDVIGDCRRCKLHRSRTRLVFGEGNPEASLVFVGEGPGAEEDRHGVPFVGESGGLLGRMIVAMGFTRDDVYIANVVKCRPPNNRTPESDEVEACERFLRAQLAIIQPQVIVALGKTAAHALLRSDRPISALRGRWHEYEGIALMPTYHPAFLLRSPDKKREAWQDLQLVMERLGVPHRPAGQPSPQG